MINNALALALWGVGIVVTAAITWFFARRGLQRPDLRSAHDFNTLIDTKDEILNHLVMLFDGREVRSVTRTTVALWNAQGGVVRGSDTLPTDRLRLQLDDDDIALYARVVSVSRTQIEAQCSIDPDNPNAAFISFDFLDAGDGFIVEILHMRSTPAGLLGTFRGADITADSHRISLTADALDAAAESSIGRLKYLRARSALSAGAILLTSIGMAALMISIAAGLLKTPDLVSFERFDLSKLDGQSEFARAVQDAGNLNRSLWVWLVLLFGTASVFFFGNAAMRIIFVRTRIPRSIVQVRVADGSSSEQRDAHAVEVSSTTDVDDNAPTTADIDIEQLRAERKAVDAVAEWQSVAANKRADREQKRRIAEEEAERAEGIPWIITYRKGDLYELRNVSNTPKFGVRISGEGIAQPKEADRIDAQSTTSFMGLHAFGVGNEIIVSWHRREDQSDRPRLWRTQRPGR